MEVWFYMRSQKIILKIIVHIDSILQYTNDIDYNQFMNNSMMVEASVFNLSQIGELVTKLDKDYIANHPEIPWLKIRGLRNRIVHDYEGVNLILIWEIIANDLKSLKEKLVMLIAN